MIAPMDDPSQNVRVVEDAMDPARAAALHLSLGLAGPPPEPGERLRPFFHQAYFWDPCPPRDLGPDGHPRPGTGLVPDLGPARRMWAGGRVSFLGPLRTGIPAERHSMLERIEHKTGRTGPLVFVTLCHEIRQLGRVAIVEWQHLVYRRPAGEARAEPRPSPAPDDETASARRRFSPPDLFRYSALTFNGHRIHYDRDYATGVEGYGGLVVHGPLLAQHLMLMAEDAMGRLGDFRFRATRPLLAGDEVDLCLRPAGEGLSLWAREVTKGHLCLQAEAR